MADAAVLTEDAKKDWRDMIYAMAIVGLGHLVRLFDQLEDCILAPIDVDRVTAAQGETVLRDRARAIRSLPIRPPTA